MELNDLIARTVIAAVWASVAVYMGFAIRKGQGIATRTYRTLITVAASGWSLYYTYRMFTDVHPEVWVSRVLQGLLVAVFWYHLWLIRIEGGHVD